MPDAQVIEWIREKYLAVVATGLEGGYDKFRWFTCLPPALLALHEDPGDDRNRCQPFRKYREAFTRPDAQS